MNDTKMKKLINQIFKFGIVGVFCFLIDYSITVIMADVLGIHYMIGKFWGFVISVIINYLLSMKFVFQRREDLERKKEFSVFIILSVIGLIINEIVIFVCIDGLYYQIPALQEIIPEKFVVSLGAVIATGVVMIYNFITRKIFIEGKSGSN